MVKESWETLYYTCSIKFINYISMLKLLHSLIAKKLVFLIEHCLNLQEQGTPEYKTLEGHTLDNTGHSVR